MNGRRSSSETDMLSIKLRKVGPNFICHVDEIKNIDLARMYIFLTWSVFKDFFLYGVQFCIERRIIIITQKN